MKSVKINLNKAGFFCFFCVVFCLMEGKQNDGNDHESANPVTGNPYQNDEVDSLLREHVNDLDDDNDDSEESEMMKKRKAILDEQELFFHKVGLPVSKILFF